MKIPMNTKWYHMNNYWDKHNPQDFCLIMISHCHFLNMRPYLRLKFFNFGIDIYTSQKVRTAKR